MTFPTSIAIADTQMLARAGIKHLLSNTAQVDFLFEAANEGELFRHLAKQQPDILVIDYHDPPHFSTDTINRILREYPEVQPLIITDDDRRQQILALLQQGVQTFITKGCSEQEVSDALFAAVRKEKFYCAKVLNYLVERAIPKESGDISLLSSREIEVVSLIAKGMVAKEIGDTLHLSTHTVYTHRKNILKKLNLRSSSELLVFALRNDLVKR